MLAAYVITDTYKTEVAATLCRSCTVELVTVVNSCQIGKSVLQLHDKNDAQVY